MSLLLGTPIPKNNIGTVVTDVFAGFDIQQKLVALMVNGLQVSEVLQHNVADYELGKVKTNTGENENETNFITLEFIMEMNFLDSNFFFHLAKN